LIKEDEREYNEYKIYENNVSSFIFNITEDELNKINSEEDTTKIFNIISSYDKELVSTIKKNEDDGFITYTKTTHTKTYDKYVCQSLKAIRTNNNFLLCKEFKKKLYSNPDINLLTRRPGPRRSSSSEVPLATSLHGPAPGPRPGPRPFPRKFLSPRPSTGRPGGRALDLGLIHHVPLRPAPGPGPLAEISCQLLQCPLPTWLSRPMPSDAVLLHDNHTRLGS
jgi:hypothetical protein